MNKSDYNYDTPSYIKECIIQYWLKGYTRDETAQSFDTSKGTVSNIWSKYRNKLGHYDPDALRELGKELRRQNMTAENCSIGFIVYNIMKKLNIPDAKTEEFLTAVNELSEKMGISPEILRDALIEFVQISDKLPFSEIPNYLQKTRKEIEEAENKKKQVEEEKQNLEKEKLAKEEQVRSALKEAKTTLFHLNNFIDTKIRLAKFGIVVEETDKFTRCVEGIGRYSNYDPFKVIEKFSDLNRSEIEIEANKKIKIDLELNIHKLKETESVYYDRLNLNSIKLKNLDELERIVGFGIQDLKKLKSILIEIVSEHKHLNIEQIKALFFELLEKIETRIALESENNAKIQLNCILENKIRINRQTLHCQKVIGHILKNMFDSGIGECEIIAMEGISDLFLNHNRNDITKKLNVKPELTMDLSNNYGSNSRLEIENIKLAINFILNAANFGKPQNHTDKLNLNESSFSSSLSNDNSTNANDRNQVDLSDSII